MKNLVKIQLILIVIISLFFGCSEEFLDKKPLGMESTATFYTSETNALQAVTACYAVMIYRGSFSRNYWAFTDCGSDDTETAGEVGGVDQPPAQRIDRLIHLPNNAYFYEFWRNIYEGINNCNIVIDKLPDAEFNENLRNRMIAEAKCLRAIYYFYLNSLFGGVPLMTEQLTPDKYYSTTRASISEVLHQVQADLEEVAGILPATYSSGDDGRVTSGTARAYLLKALVFESSYAKNYPGDARFTGCEQKWDQAWNVAQQIISSSRYVLEPHYADIWTEAGEDSQEHIFRVISASLLQGGTAELINQTLVSTVLNTYQSCRAYWEVTIDTVESVIVRDSVAVDGGRNGWGLNAPTYNLAAEYEEGDPRFRISITTDEDTLLIDFGLGDIQPRRAAPSYASPTMMNNKKYDPPPGEWTINNFFKGPRDIKMFRYADVLLLAAEAALDPAVNQPDRALEYVNMIRTRARNSGNTGQPADLSSVDLSDVMHERRIELAMEAHRYLDIVRWGIAYDKLDGLYRATDTLGGLQGDPIQFIKGKNEFFPIPEQEIILSKGAIVQNPGY